jgi:copper chaperone CopZ
MHCGSCIRRVTQAIGASGDVAVDEVRLGAARFHPISTPATTATQAAIAALAKAGFAARVEN